MYPTDWKMRLLILSTLLTGVLSWKPREVHIKAGEMVALQCPSNRGPSHSKTELMWTSHTEQDLNLSHMSTEEQRRMGVLIHGRSLVILNVSVSHQGNYSCSFGTPSRQFWFRLRVYATRSREYEERTMNSATCYIQESCTLHCPDNNIPDVNTPNITSSGIVWHKRGESLPNSGFFPSVDEDDHGVYTCTRSYMYRNKVYIMTFSVVLDVQPSIISGTAEILSPHKNDVFYVALDTTVVIECKAVVYSDFDDVFWLSGTSFVESNNNLRVFYNSTRENDPEGMKITASLVFRKVSKEDLSKSYSCKLESVDQPSSFVTITLAQKTSPLSLPLHIVTVAIVGMIVFVTAVAFVKFRKDISLVLQNTFCCHRSISDVKSYDAFLMYYKSDTDTGLTEEDKEWLESDLEERLGYSLCPWDHNVLPRRDVAKSVFDCIAQSWTVVLVPTSTDPGPGSCLLKEIHASLMEQQTRLVFIKAELGSVPEALQPLSEAGHSIVWRGKHSMKPSSSFWKQLRCYLEAPQYKSREGLLLKTTTPDNCRSI